MQGLYDAHARETESDPSAQDNNESRYYMMERRGHPDRRKKERRASKAGAKQSGTGMLQPILTQAEIAALLRGAR